MNDLTYGLNGFGRAPRFALRNGMGWMFLMPLLLWALFAFGLFQAGAWAVDVAQAWAEKHMGLQVQAGSREGWAGMWDNVKAFANGARDVLVLIILKVAIFWLLGLVGKYVVLILLSPLLAYASERTEELLTGKRTPFHLGRWMREVLRGIIMAFRNGAVETLINIAAWGATLFLPILGPFTAILLWTLSCWFYGFSMFDYIHERHGLGLRASLRTARQRPGMVLANGMLFNLLMKIPVLGLMTAPLMGSIGAVLASHASRTIGYAPA